MPVVLRIIDANANRAREALRVMEEAARFILNDSSLVKKIKQLRHDLAVAVEVIPNLQAYRDTPQDVGTQITTATEMTRTAVSKVVLAAGKRLSEALRAIEEYAKTLGEIAPDLAPVAEQLRYRGYHLEQQLNGLLAAALPKQYQFCVLLSEAICQHHTWFEVAQAAVHAGADCLQLREKKLDAEELLKRAKQLVELCQPKQVTVIVNDRPDVAVLAGADGVHLGQTDLPCQEVRKLVGRQLLIGVSTSSVQEAEMAFVNGADYCGVGPMFPTTTKQKKMIAGPTYLMQYLEQNRLPHLAIGGITAQTLPRLLSLGVKGIAVSAAVCASQDPYAAAAELLEMLTVPI